MRFNINISLDNHYLFRSLFFVLLVIVPPITEWFDDYNSLFVLTVLFLGLGFWNKSNLFLFLSCTFVVFIRTVFREDFDISPLAVLTRLLIYLAVTFSASIVARQFHEIKLSRLKDQHLLVRVFEKSPIGMAMLSFNGAFKANSSLCNMLGFSEAELKNLRVQAITHPEDLEADLKLWHKLVQGEIDYYQIEKRYIHKSGDIKWGLLNVTVERDQQGIDMNDIYIFQIVDITEQKLREEKVKESEKLSLIGELAAGIAHEIRNPLTSIRGFVQLDQSEDADNIKKLRYEVMLSEIDRINEIVSELLVLAKPTTERYGLKSIINKLNHVVTLLEGQANLCNVQLIKEFDTNLSAVLIHSQGNLKQVFINVLKNAIESMTKGGEVRIQANRVDDKVCIRIIDQGCGIPKDELAKIGNPFFTTKEKGTGLGVMVSHRIIQNHKGHMRIESEVGKGTAVEVILPFAR
ncbi:ATP-binding protein [Ammoniphilus sp. 3BR4]|uniref:ATP-binding protein n=1 Tax=Ammoniphilus sp. 3BR4 TaxID=3158265 RepID=UPI0034668D9C